MLPAAYQLPAAAVLVAGGLLSCLVGYRLFKVVLAIFGFIIGGLAASSVFGESAATAMVIAAVVGGLCGAFLLLAAYFVGVALVGAGLGVACVHLVWTQIQGDPHPAVVILGAVAGALLSTWLQRYVIILGTAFGGAWTVVVGAAALLGNPTALQAAAGVAMHLLGGTQAPLETDSALKRNDQNGAEGRPPAHERPAEGDGESHVEKE